MARTRPALRGVRFVLAGRHRGATDARHGPGLACHRGRRAGHSSNSEGAMKTKIVYLGNHILRFYSIRPHVDFGPFNIYGHRGFNFGWFGISLNPYPHGEN